METTVYRVVQEALTNVAKHARATCAGISVRHAEGMLRVVVTDIAGYDTFYKRLIAALPLKNVTSRFAMEKIKSTTALPIP